MKTLILILGCLLLLVPCQAAEDVTSLGKRSEDIENYISQRRLDIENYYRGQLIEISQRVEEEISLLEVADKAIYAGLDEQAEVAKTVLHIDNFGFHAPWYHVADTERSLRLTDDCELWRHNNYCEGSFKNPPKRFAAAHSKIAERKSRILAQLEWEILTLEQRREYALTTGLAQLEKQLKEQAIQPELRTTQGIVTGIIYSSDRPSAGIDRKIVHQGDTIGDVKVTRIYEDKVEFEKNGKKWEQKVQQKPATYW